MAAKSELLSEQLVAMNEALVRGSVHQHERNAAGDKRNKRLEKLVANRTAALTRALKRLLAEVHDRKRLESEIAKVVEGEQLRLGQELHDGLAQELTGAMMILYTLEQNLKKASSPHAGKAHEVYQMLLGTAKQARNLASGFYPVELEKHGLVVALRQLARRTQESFGVPCAVQTGKHVPAQWKDTRAIQLFRIAQEAVHNAIKHARAGHIRIRLTLRKHSWLLTVKDDGIGLRPTRRRDGMGRHIMQHRAGLIDGKLEVRNADGGGVIVSCVVPEPRKMMSQTHTAR
jgi:signal transduction histidine kinase